MKTPRRLFAKIGKRKVGRTAAQAAGRATDAATAASSAAAVAGRGMAGAVHASGRAAVSAGTGAGRAAKASAATAGNSVTGAARRIVAAGGAAVAALKGQPTARLLLDGLYAAQQGCCADCGGFAMPGDLRAAPTRAGSGDWALFCSSCAPGR